MIALCVAEIVFLSGMRKLPDTEIRSRATLLGILEIVAGLFNLVSLACGIVTLVFASTATRPRYALTERTAPTSRGAGTPVRTVFTPRATATLLADHFRYPGEQTALGMAIAILAVGIGVFSVASAGVLFALFIIALLVTKASQASLRSAAHPVDEKSQPRIYRLARTSAERLELPFPKTYLSPSHEVNAYALGFWDDFSVICNAALVDKLNDEELLFVIGHEHAHIKCKHTSWLVFTGSTPIPNNWLAILFQFAFWEWSKKAEFTCDRGGLIACRNPRAAMSALVKISTHGEVDDRTLNSWVAAAEVTEHGTTLSDVVSTHPETIKRLAAVQDFAQSEQYAQCVGFSR
jgi:Zn-dependent protease with chaperone function